MSYLQVLANFARAWDRGEAGFREFFDLEERLKRQIVYGRYDRSDWRHGSSYDWSKRATWNRMIALGLELCHTRSKFTGDLFLAEAERVFDWLENERRYSI